MTGAFYLALVLIAVVAMQKLGWIEKRRFDGEDPEEAKPCVTLAQDVEAAAALDAAESELKECFFVARELAEKLAETDVPKPMVFAEAGEVRLEWIGLKTKAVLQLGVAPDSWRIMALREGPLASRRCSYINPPADPVELVLMVKAVEAAWAAVGYNGYLAQVDWHALQDSMDHIGKQVEEQRDLDALIFRADRAERPGEVT